VQVRIIRFGHVIIIVRQDTKAGSAATLPQQEKSNSADVPLDRANITDLNSCYAACACGINLGVGLRRPCRGQACGDMLG
jgi:hypothetical protein